MKILSVEAKNFARFLELKVSYDNQGLVLVEGINQDSADLSPSNGAGKSTALRDSLLIGLFGKNGDGLNIEQRLLGGSNTKIEVNFIGNDGQNYKVVREFKKGKSKTVDLYKNNSTEPLGLHNAKDVQEKIDTLLGGDFLCMVNTCIPTSDDGLFSESGEGQQKDILDSILGVTRISKAQLAAKKLSSESKTELARLEDQDNSISGKIQQINQSIQTLENTKQTLEVQKRQQIEKKQLEISQIFQKLEDIQGKVIQTLQSITASEQNITSYNPQEIQSSISYYQTEMERLRADLGVQNHIVQTSQKEISLLSAKIDRLYEGKFEGDICSSCGALVSMANINELRRHIDMDRSQLAGKIAEAQKVIGSNNSLIQENREKMEGWANANKYLNDTKVHINQLNTSLQSLRYQEETNLSLINRLKSDIEQIQSQSTDIDTEITKVKVQLNQAQAIKAQNQQKIQEHQFNQKHIDFWVDAFGPGKQATSLPMYLYNSAINRFNESIDKYVKLLYGTNMMVTVSTTKRLSSGEEKAGLTLQIQNLMGSNELLLNSKGERKRVNLAITFALLDLTRSINKVQPNILILDEIDNAMDEGGVLALVEILNTLVKQIPTIFLITHKSELKDYFRRRWVVVKNNGISKLYENQLQSEG